MDKGTELYRAYLDGDESALEAIIDMYRQGLVLFINRYLGDLVMSEDLAIDIFACLIVSPHKYDFRVSLKTYLFMLARSRAIDKLRHDRVLRFADRESEDLCSIPDPDSIYDELEADELRRAVWRAIASLPDDMRTVVHLVYIEDMSYDEAARVMDKKRKQIDNLLYRAKNLLRERLGEEGRALL